MMLFLSHIEVVIPESAQRLSGTQGVLQCAGPGSRLCGPLARAYGRDDGAYRPEAIEYRA